MYKRLRLYLGVFIAILTIGLAAPVGAIDESFYTGNGIFYYNPDDTGATCPSSPTTVQAGSLDAFLQALAKQESGGNPKAANPGSSARGKYQYLTDTWRARYTLYPPAKSYSTADQAPEAVQDAVAYIEYAQKWKQFDGSIFKLAISHFYPAANSDESLLDQHIGTASNPTPRQYADSVVEKVNNGFGSEIPLKYSEAPDFQKYLSAATGGASDFSNPTAVPATTGSGGCASTAGGGGVLGEGGLTEAQAKTFVMNYGANKGGDSAKYAGALWPFCEGGGANCVTFSYFFNHKFTNLPASPSDGNGENIVDSLRSKGAKTGNVPKVFSTFSWESSYGHTGIVLGIHGDQVIVGQASCSSGSPGAGDGTTLGKGAAIIRVGKANDGNTWLGKVPTEFAYPDKVDTAKIEAYVNGNI